jgi:hypothetical protein
VELQLDAAIKVPFDAVANTSYFPTRRAPTHPNNFACNSFNRFSLLTTACTPVADLAFGCGAQWFHDTPLSG